MTESHYVGPEGLPEDLAEVATAHDDGVVPSDEVHSALRSVRNTDDWDADDHHPSASRSGQCSREHCYRRAKEGSTECNTHSLRTPEEFAFQMGYQLREQILRMPFRGTMSTYPDDPPYGIGVDTDALDALEEVGLIDPVPVPETSRWVYTLTDLGREVVQIVRSTGGKSNRYVKRDAA